MLKLVRLTAFTVAGFILAAPVFAEDKIAAKVNGVAIPMTRVELEVKEFAKQGAQDSPEMRQEILNRLINLELLSQEAQKKGLDKQPDVQEQLVLSRQSVLARSFMMDYAMNHPPSDEALHQQFDRLKGDPRLVEFKVAHILVKDQKEAQSIAASLKKGGNFAAIAKAKSGDPGSKDKGGSLDWITVFGIAPEFADAMVRLKKGELSAPVRTQFGWHIIKVEDTRPMPFEHAKPFLMQPVQEQAVQKMAADLRKSSEGKIEIMK